METIISKIKIRRGKDSERKQIIFDAGEPAFAYDTGRLCIGDGQTVGGVPINKTFYLSGNELDSINLSAIPGDFAYTKNKLYLAAPSGSNMNWVDTGVKILSNGGLDYNNSNELAIKTPNAPLSISNGQLTLDYNSDYFALEEGNKLTIQPNIIPNYNFNDNDFSGSDIISINKIGAIQTVTIPNILSSAEIDGDTYYNDWNTGVGVSVVDPIVLSTTQISTLEISTFSKLDPTTQAELTALPAFSGYADNPDREIGISTTVETEALALNIDERYFTIVDGKLSLDIQKIKTAINSI